MDLKSCNFPHTPAFLRTRHICTVHDELYICCRLTLLCHITRKRGSEDNIAKIMKKPCFHIFSVTSIVGNMQTNRAVLLSIIANCLIYSFICSYLARIFCGKVLEVMAEVNTHKIITQVHVQVHTSKRYN